jgi:hypothetical protein
MSLLLLWLKRLKYWPEKKPAICSEDQGNCFRKETNYSIFNQKSILGRIAQREMSDTCSRALRFFQSLRPSA